MRTFPESHEESFWCPTSNIQVCERPWVIFCIIFAGLYDYGCGNDRDGKSDLSLAHILL
jgi:hypothetical protein